MTVTLGPDAGAPKHAGSRPAEGECRPVEILNQRVYLDATWIKGHLLNDNLGGPGVTKNLTPLTDQANKEHSGKVEGPIKGAIAACSTRATYYKDDYWFGVRYRVRVLGQRWPSASNGAVKAVGSTLKYSAVYVKQDKSSNAVTPGGHNSLPKLPPGTDAIDCAAGL